MLCRKLADGTIVGQHCSDSFASVEGAAAPDAHHRPCPKPARARACILDGSRGGRRDPTADCVDALLTQQVQDECGSVLRPIADASDHKDAVAAPGTMLLQRRLHPSGELALQHTMAQDHAIVLSVRAGGVWQCNTTRLHGP